jgi:hypothetical protein
LADYTITDLPREPTDDEAKRMTSVLIDMFGQFEFERLQPSHLCEKDHAGEIVETLDWEIIERQEFPRFPLEIDGGTLPAIHPASGEQTVTRTHQQQPTCHDCGRALYRPPGTDDQTWLCPHALRMLPAGKPDSAIECGGVR